MIDAVEQKLAGSDDVWLGGQQPSKEDAEQFASIEASRADVSPATHPHTFAWHILVGRVHENVRSTWPASQNAPGAANSKGKN